MKNQFAKLRIIITSLSLGIGLGIIGLGVSILIWFYNFGNAGGTLLIPASLAGLVSGSFFWWLWILRHQKYTIARGFYAGIVAGLVAHPLMWYLNILRANICYYLLHCPSCTSCPPPMTLLQGFSGSIFLSSLSLYYWGWLTIPVGGILGILLILGKNRKTA